MTIYYPNFRLLPDTCFLTLVPYVPFVLSVNLYLPLILYVGLLHMGLFFYILPLLLPDTYPLQWSPTYMTPNPILELSLDTYYLHWSPIL
jgi:hypothetical protein